MLQVEIDTFCSSSREKRRIPTKSAPQPQTEAADFIPIPFKSPLSFWAGLIGQFNQAFLWEHDNVNFAN
jgi:hypothetical protein